LHGAKPTAEAWVIEQQLSEQASDLIRIMAKHAAAPRAEQQMLVTQVGGKSQQFIQFALASPAGFGPSIEANWSE